jgi:hypothetical protein
MKLVKNQNEGTGSGSKVLYTGIASGNVIAVNPDKAQLCAILGVGDDVIKEEPKYEGEDKDGKAFVSLSFWLEANTPGKEKFNARFRLTDKPMVGQKSGKAQFVAVNGEFGWADVKENLREGFTHWQTWDNDNKKFVTVTDTSGEKLPRAFRDAIMGEADLYQFLRAWISHVDWRNPSDNSMLIDTKKLFRNPDKYVQDEYRSMIGVNQDDSLVDSVIFLATIYVGEKDGQKIQYQNVAKFYLANGMRDTSNNPVMMKKVNLAMQTGVYTGDSTLKRWHKEVTDSEHGVKENYILQPLGIYDEAKFLNESNSVISHDNTPVNDAEY